MSLEQIIQNSVAPVIITAIFLWFMDRTNKQNAENAKQAENQRIENAKALEQERREHESTVFNLLATTMKQMLTEVIQSNKEVVAAVHDHESNSQDRYDRQGNTKDVIKKLDEMNRKMQEQRQERNK
jgi:hypothetical protein